MSLSARIGFVAGCLVQMKLRSLGDGLEEEALAWAWVDVQLACALLTGPASWSPLPLLPLTTASSYDCSSCGISVRRCNSMMHYRCLSRLFNDCLVSKSISRMVESCTAPRS